MPSILDWPLPLPAYDEVTTELEDQSDDQEVRSINRGLAEDSFAPPISVAEGRSESQSADLFQELQREVESRVLWYCYNIWILLSNGVTQEGRSRLLRRCVTGFRMMRCHALFDTSCTRIWPPHH